MNLKNNIIFCPICDGKLRFAFRENRFTKNCPIDNFYILGKGEPIEVCSFHLKINYVECRYRIDFKNNNSELLMNNKIFNFTKIFEPDFPKLEKLKKKLSSIIIFS